MGFITYNNRDEMINDTTLKEGDVCRTLGFYTPFDDGGAEYIIVSKNAKPIPGADGNLSNGRQLYTINYTPSNTNKVNIADITIEDTTIVSVTQAAAKKGYVKIAITPKIIGETYITLTNKFKPEVTKRIRVIVRSE